MLDVKNFNIFIYNGKNRLVVPFLKWVGGKRQLIPTIKKGCQKDCQIVLTMNHS